MVRAWTIWRGAGPIVATAIHDGHDVRPDVARYLGVTEAERRREEDPHTAHWTSIASHRVVVHRSRFEVDLNRPRDQAIYLDPAQSWGMQVWKSPPPTRLVEESLANYDSFYVEMFNLLDALRTKHGRFVVLDLHSYNHCREGQHAAPACAGDNPEINVGTGTMDRERWRPLVERFMADLRRFRRDGRSLDVRENVRFRGGGFPRWIHETFPTEGCALAIEVKKFFMNEWTGQADVAQIEFVREALASTIPGILHELDVWFPESNS